MSLKILKNNQKWGYNYNTVLQYFIHLQGLGSSQFADHLANEKNRGPCYVKNIQAVAYNVVHTVSHILLKNEKHYNKKYLS